MGSKKSNKNKIDDDSKHPRKKSKEVNKKNNNEELKKNKKKDSHKEENSQEEEEEESEQISEKQKAKLKKNILMWIECDDKIKEFQVKSKIYKEKKKQIEEKVLSDIDRLNVQDSKLETERGNVFQSVSHTKGAIKADIIKDALKGYVKKERHIDELIKKIDTLRPIKERVYLKRVRDSGSKRSKN